VKFFAGYKEAIGIEQVEIGLEEGSDVSSLIEVIKEKHPKLGELTETLVISVNWEYATYDTKLKDGDEVALLPPVSGG
jgi:molybdopterin converting factor subunit 1